MNRNYTQVTVLDCHHADITQIVMERRPLRLRREVANYLRYVRQYHRRRLAR